MKSNHLSSIYVFFCTCIFFLFFFISLHFFYFSLFLLISLYFFFLMNNVFLCFYFLFRFLDQPNSVESNLLQPAPPLSLAEHGMILIYFDSGERELRILHAISPDVYNIFIHVPIGKVMKSLFCRQFRWIWMDLGSLPGPVPEHLMEVFVYGGIHSATPDRVLNDGFWS